MLKDVFIVTMDNLEEEVLKLKGEGYRLAAVSCEREGEGLEITYNFDLGYKMKHLRISLEKHERVKSISNIYPSAFLIENEFQDLYGFSFDGLTIDYRGRLYLAENAPKNPLLSDD